MTKEQELYQVLEQMIECAVNNDAEKLDELNKKYDEILGPNNFKPLPEPYLSYDLCRNSCAGSLGMFNCIHDQLIADAKQRYEQLSKP